MSTREGPVTTRISGHTGPDGGRLDAHVDARTGNGRTLMMDAEVRANGQNGRSMGELFRELSQESGTLVRQEIALAKAEMREKMEVFQKSMVSMGIGGVLLLAALLTGLWAVNMGLTALLTEIIGVGVAVWLSPLLLTVALGAIGWGMIKGGKEKMAHEGIAPRRTASTLEQDKRWAQNKMHEVKEDITHGR